MRFSASTLTFMATQSGVFRPDTVGASGNSAIVHTVLPLDNLPHSLRQGQRLAFADNSAARAELASVNDVASMDEHQLAVLKPDLASTYERKLVAAYPNIFKGSSEYGVQMYKNNGDGTFTDDPVQLPNNAGSEILPILNLNNMVFADVDNDGDRDLIIGGNGGVVILKYNHLDGTYSLFKRLEPTSAGSIQPDTLMVADFEGNGRVGIIAGTYKNTNYYWIQTAKDVWSQKYDLPGRSDSAWTRSLDIGDVNNDGKIDIVISEDASSIVLLNSDLGAPFEIHSNPTAVPNYIGSGASYISGTKLADINGDGNLDLVRSLELNVGIEALLGNGDGTFENPVALVLPGITNEQFVYIDVGDMNNDGNIDVVLVIHHNSEASGVITSVPQYLYLGNGDGTFRNPTILGYASDRANGVDIADFDGDGKLDAVFSHYDAAPRLFLGDGDGTFKAYTELPFTPHQDRGHRIAVDFNNLAPLVQPASFAPTPSPWEIVFKDMAVNFTLGSSDEVILTYEIGSAREYDTQLYAKGCKSGSEGNHGDRVDIDIDGGILLTPKDGIDDKAPTSPQSMMSKLTLTYDFNNTALARSNIWNNEASKIELCQVVQLTYDTQEPNTDPLVIVEDIRNVTIDFDLFANFTIDGNITLAAATINANNATTDVDSYVDAFRCDGTEMNKVDIDLKPNDELFVCIQSTSADIEIAKLDSMIIKGVNPNGEADQLDVINTDGPTYPAFTSLEYVATGAVVSTRVPTSEFDFETDGASILVGGRVIMKFVESTGPDERKLKLAGARRNIQADVANEEASFELAVSLQSEAATDEEAAMINSADSVAGKNFAILGMIFAAAYALW